MRKLGEDQKIDFVIAWVDGNDPEWRREKSDRISGISGFDRVDDREEKFAPWVRKIHLVTWGHIPH